MKTSRSAIARARVTLRTVAFGAALTAVSACRLSPYHFAGGGLPPNIRTIAVLPFDNQTPIPELQRDLFDAMRTQLFTRLNLRDASENKADAIVRGAIVKYDADVPVGYAAGGQSTQARRQLQLVVDVAIIDQSTGRTLYERKALTEKADYAERQEVSGRQQAIQQVVTDLIEGAQSQW
ncbi:MAG TPA: LPS assembly lipoprotein LptE [Gemmatirosa sp.]